jgi:hypothetical protein
MDLQVEPDIRRLPASEYKSLAGPPELDVHSNEGNNARHSDSALVIKHVVLSKANAVKLYQRSRLDKAYLGRMLDPEVRQDIASEPYSCFAVRFDSKEQQYVFNGQRVKMMEVACSEMSKIFDENIFPVLDAMVKGDLHAKTERVAPSESRDIQIWQSNVDIDNGPEQYHIDRCLTSDPNTELASIDFEDLVDPCPEVSSGGGDAVISMPSTNTASCNGHEKSNVNSTSLLTHGPKYTKVDRNGLTADAASTAEWEHNNFVSNLRKVASIRNSKANEQYRQQNVLENVAPTVSFPKISPAASNKLQAPSTFDDLLSPDFAMPALRQFPENYAATKTTMKQCAKNKGKRPKSKGNTSAKKTVVTLPLPDPIPTKRKSSSTASCLEPNNNQLPSRNQHQRSRIDMLVCVSDKSPSQLKSLDLIKEAPQRTQHKLGVRISRGSNDDDHDGESDVLTTGNVKVTGDIGMLLILASANADQLLQADSAAKLAALLTNGEQVRDTTLLPRITTSSHDAERLLKMLPASFKLARRETLYEFRLRTTNGVEEIVFDPAAASGDRGYYRSRLSPDQGIGYLHFADRVWDARIRVATPPTNDPLAAELDKAILDFLKSLKTDGSPPSINGAFDIGAFVPQEVLAKRVVTHSDGDLSFIVTEVQDLQLSLRNNKQLGFRAQGLPRKQMIESQRIWIEARFEANHLDQLPALQEHLRNLVTAMDDIGESNRGPSCFATAGNHVEETTPRDDTGVSEDTVYW